MAIPTITSVTPSYGSTRGDNMVNIVGTNFRLPSAPPSGNVNSDQELTINVSIAGVKSDWAYAASGTLILARIPEWRGSPIAGYDLPVDVRVANTDASGVEIPTENATLVDGYTYQREKLSSESYLQRVCHEIILLFRRHLLANTHQSPSIDYDDDPSTWERLREKSPVVYLVGPKLPLNTFDTIQKEQEELTVGNEWKRRKPPITCDIEYEVHIWAKRNRQAYNLVQSLLLMFRDINDIKILVDPADPSKGYVFYEWEIDWSGYPEMSDAPNQDDLRGAKASIIVRGVHIDTEGGTIVQEGWIVFSNDGMPALETEDL